MSGAIVHAKGLVHRYGEQQALGGVSLTLSSNQVIGFIGPDGVGKSSLLGLIAGVTKLQQGELDVLGGDIRQERRRNRICDRIAYMPQGLGKNLYQTLSVRQNVMFFAHLFGLSQAQRKVRVAELLTRTGLAPFADRPAGKLSGGMKQKLGLCCALVHQPDLLILDEPTTGVDPLSRRQFWNLVTDLRIRQPGLTVLVATAYMEEASAFDYLVAMNEGQVLVADTPQGMIEATGQPTLEAAFISLLPESTLQRSEPLSPHAEPKLEEAEKARPVAIEAAQLTRNFGNFKAVDDVSLQIRQGEIFGFIGSNGCGKTTTMKMLTGLLPVSQGSVKIFGHPVDAGDSKTRQRIGYMSQSFSLYSELSVEQNLRLHARLFGLSESAVAQRTGTLLEHFQLTNYRSRQASSLPLGIRQRLSLAVAMVHEPELLILDEPTSGVDPLARDAFWDLLLRLSREQGVTIFISTHFMNEAMRCDRIAMMSEGRVLATDAPQAIIDARGVDTLEAAFIDYLRETDEGEATSQQEIEAVASLQQGPPKRGRFFSLQRLLAFSRRELMEVFRDPIRLAFSFFGTIVLMLIFGYGITMDVNELAFAAFDRDQTPHSRQYAEGFLASPYFRERSALHSQAEMNKALQSGDVRVVIEIPPGFGRALLNGQPAEVMVWVDGSMPFRGSTINGYVRGVHQQFLEEGLRMVSGEGVMLPVSVDPRFLYNQDFKSIYAMVPAVIALLLIFIPAILMALGIVREKELGSITNFYATPVTRLEFLLGKQLPYIGIGMFNYFVMLAMALFIFKVPLHGSFFTLTLAALLYVTTTTGIGLFMSALTRTQIAALAATSILSMLPATEFSGLIIPVSALEGVAYWMGQFFPTTYFLKISVGSFTKSLDWVDVAPDLMKLALMVPVITGLSWMMTKKQAA